MKKLLYLLLLGLSLLLGPELFSQDAEGATQSGEGHGGDTVLRQDEIGMEFYRPTRVSPRALFHTIEKLYQREILVEGPDGSISAIDNLIPMSDTLLIYDTPTQAAKILATLERLEAELSDPEDSGQEPRLEVFEYTPRYLAIESVRDGLRPFQRQVSPPDGPPINNTTFVKESGLVIVRDTAAQVSEIREFLQRVDVPGQQVLITCWVIEGDDDAQGGKLPEALSQNLRNLLPYAGYRQIAVGMLRVDAHNSNRFSIGLSNVESVYSYTLSVIPGAYDATEKRLTLAHCKFSIDDSRDLFSTSTSVQEGEFAVIGVAGDEPLFVVLRVTAV